MHSSFFRCLDAAISESQQEYLAFGKISGSGYKAVSLATINLSGGLRRISPGLFPHYPSLRAAIEGAKCFANCFGPYFGLPAASTLMSFPDDRQSWKSTESESINRVLDSLMDIELLKEWCREEFVVPEDPDATPDSNRASFVFNKVIKRRLAREKPQVDEMSSVAKRLSVMGIRTIHQMRFPSQATTNSYHPSSVAGTGTVKITDDGASTVFDAQYPGRMEFETKIQLAAAQCKTPRFLFRG